MTPFTSPRIRWSSIVLVLALGVLLCAGVSCSSTVTPPRVEAAVIAFDGTEQNAGIVSLAPGGAIITPNRRNYHNALIALYGEAKDSKTGLPLFTPALTKDYGITAAPPNFFITAEALTKHTLMHQWYKTGRKP